MRKNDPKRLALIAKRDKANLDLSVLLAGIGKQLIDYSGECSHYYLDSIESLMQVINTTLFDAIALCKKLEKEYEPYRLVRRRRTIVKVRK
jgi:hypothetical protein